MHSSIHITNDNEAELSPPLREPNYLKENDERLKDIHRLIAERGVLRAEAGLSLISPKGHVQNWLVDLRRIFLHSQTLRLIADCFWCLYWDAPPFQIGGMETAAIPLLTAILLRAPPHHKEANGFIIRKERKTYGLGNIIEGNLNDDPVVLVDDILNSAESAEKACAAVELVGKKVSDLFVVIDFQSPKGLAWRKAKSIRSASLFQLADFGLTLGKGPSPKRPRFRQLWHARVSGGNPYYVVPKSAPVLGDGGLFRGSDSGNMHCFDVSLGRIKWEFKAQGAGPKKGIWSTPAVANGRVYFGAYNGVVYCLDAKSGAMIWTQSYCEWVGASPAISLKHNIMYIGLELERPWARGSLTALELDSGNKVWELPVGKYQHGSAAYWEDGDLVIWGTADHEILAIDARAGEPIWRFKTGRSVKYAPAIDRNRKLVAFASFDKSIYILDIATGKKRGEWKTDEICYTTPLFYNDKLYCGSGDRFLYVIDVDKMALVKKIDTHARIYSSPSVFREAVIFGTTGGKVFRIDPITLESEDILQLPDAITNAIAVDDVNGSIYVSTYMNDLFAFQEVD